MGNPAVGEEKGNISDIILYMDELTANFQVYILGLKLSLDNKTWRKKNRKKN